MFRKKMRHRNAKIVKVKAMKKMILSCTNNMALVTNSSIVSLRDLFRPCIYDW